MINILCMNFFLVDIWHEQGNPACRKKYGSTRGKKWEENLPRYFSRNLSKVYCLDRDTASFMEQPSARYPQRADEKMQPLP